MRAGYEAMLRPQPGAGGGSDPAVFARGGAAVLARAAIALAAVRPLERLLGLAPVALVPAAAFGIGRARAFLTVSHGLPFHSQVTIILEECLIVNDPRPPQGHSKPLGLVREGR